MPRVDWPSWDEPASRDERCIGYLNFLLSWCQPLPSVDGAALERFSRIGTGPGRPFDADALEPQTRDGMRSGIDAARAKIAKRSDHLGNSVNGW